jgi:hypothetical protein
MFKHIHPHARLWIATNIVIGLILAFKPITQFTETIIQPTHPKGVLVAYYQNDYQRYAIELLTEEGNVEQYPCLYELWTTESNWRPKAVNKSSNALGIAQLLPQTWININVEPTKDGYKQVRAGLKYIDRRYGTGRVCKAYAHSLARGWY